MAAVGKVSDLVSLLDGQLSAVQAANLLQEANGCMETAVAKYFASLETKGTAESGAGPSAMSNASGLTTPNRTLESKVHLLKSMLPHIADATLMKHLKDAKGSIDRAADAILSGQLEGQGKSGDSTQAARFAVPTTPAETSSHASVREVTPVTPFHGSRGISKQELYHRTAPSQEAGQQMPNGHGGAGPSKVSPLDPDSKEDDKDEVPKRRPKRQRVATVRFSPTVTTSEPLPEKRVQLPLLSLGTSASGDGFVVRRGDGQEYALPLRDHRTPQGRLFAPYETELPDLVRPVKELNFDSPGLHLGSFCISLDANAAKDINRNSGFVEVAWSEPGFLKRIILIDGDGKPSGVFQKWEPDDVLNILLSAEAKQAGGLNRDVENSLFSAHRDGIVRLFATLDNCGKEWVDGGKKGGKRQPDSALSSFTAFTRKHHSTPRGPAVFLHVCMTEKACRYNYEDGGFGGLKNGKTRKGNNHLLAITIALRSYGFGLEQGPDSDEYLNFGSDGAPQEAVSEQHYDLFNLLASIDLPESAPAAASPPQLLTQPMKYQLKALSWMMTREGALGGSNVRRNILTLHPCWQQLLTADGQVLYVQREDGACSQNFYTAPHRGTCGGLLCDEMGLGKTLEMLMLVLAHPPPLGWAVTDVATWDKSESVMPIRATLVVVPASLLDQWRREVELHVRPGALKVLHYEGRHRRGGGAGKRASVNWGLEQYDIIITSYEVIRTELAGSADSPLLSYGFWRVVLDEAQLVANSSSVAAITASSIMRRHAWVVTGTPITSRLDELQGLLDFLAVQPFGEPAVFRALLKIPYEARSVAGLQRLRVLLKTIMIRRTKSGVASEMVLPPCTKLDSVLTFSDAEASYYQRVHETFVASIKRMDRVQATRDARKLEGFDPSNLAARVTGQALANLTRLRQACCHPQIIRAGNDYLGKARLTMPQIMAKLVERARAAHDGAARDWLVARVALAVATAKEGSKLASTIFDPLLSDIAKCASLALERSGLIKAPVDGDVETERSTRQTVTRTNYWKLELTTLNAYSQFLGADLADGEQVEGTIKAVEDRIVELEDSLGITAERIAKAEVGRKLTRGEQKKQDEAIQRLAEQECALWQSVGWQRARGETGEGSSGAGPSTSAAAAAPFTGRLTRHGKRTLEEAFGPNASGRDADPSKLSDYDKEIDDILEGPAVTRKGKKARTPEQRISAANTAVQKAKEKMEDLYRQEKHLDFKLDEMEKGKAKVSENGASTSGGIGNGAHSSDDAMLPGEFLATTHTVIQEDKTQCPICLDSCEDCGAVTVCGHYFCSDCIHEYIQTKGSDAPCPLCRHKLKTKDVFNACKEPERRQGELPDLSGEYGTKISALISELIGIRSKDPAAKSVIFSSWRLLLNLAGEALAHNGFQYSLLWGRPDERVKALKDFNENPNVRAILVLMGNSGGAAGLTLTAASTAFILEPSVNPGMEAQAAARIHRLSQGRPTRVVRFIVDKTIEPKIVRLQTKKLAMGGGSGGGIVMEQLRGQDLLELIEDDAKGKQRVNDIVVFQ